MSDVVSVYGISMCFVPMLIPKSASSRNKQVPSDGNHASPQSPLITIGCASSKQRIVFFRPYGKTPTLMKKHGVAKMAVV